MDSANSNAAKPRPHLRLFSLLRPEGHEVAVIVFFSALTGVLYLATPLAVDAVVQNIAWGGQQNVFVQSLLIFSFALLSFLALLSVVSAAQHFVAELIQRRIFARLAADLSFRLPRLRVDDFEKSKTLELINRFLDVTTLQKSSAMILLDGVNVLLSALIGMIALAFYHPFLLAFDLILLLLLTVALFPLGRDGVRSAIRESYAKHAVAGWFEQIVLAPVFFKSPGGKALAETRTSSLINDYLEKRKSHYRVLLRQIIGLLALQALASASLLGIGGFLVVSGQLTLGQLVASELIVGAIVASFVSFGKHIEMWYDAMAATDKLGSLIDLKIERQTGALPEVKESASTIRLRDVVFAYENKARPLFSGLNLDIRAGERLGITGTIGAGAGTVIELIYGLREIQEGTIFIDGVDIRHWSLDALRDRVALVRNAHTFEGTILENVLVGRSAISLEQATEVLDRVGLLDKVMGFPDGLNTVLRPGGRPLSNSQRVKLAFARALVGQPRLLLVDKALDGLDSDTSGKLLSAVFDPNAAFTLALATRDRSLLQRCERVVYLDPDNPRQNFNAAPLS